MRALQALQIAMASLTAASSATRLYVASYSGILETLELHQNTLTSTATQTNCGANATWLTLDAQRSTLLCLNEGLTTPNGSVAAYQRRAQGLLHRTDHVPKTPSGPVNSAIYFDNPSASSSSSSSSSAPPRAVAIAHYAGSAVTSYALSASGTVPHLRHQQTFSFTLASPGPVPDRQDAPHPHQALPDPTRAFVLVPDLGADLLRVFPVDASTGLLGAPQLIAVAPGSGPRHAAFHVAGPATFLYLVSELDGSLTAFAVQYLGSGGLALRQIQRTTTFGGPAGPAGAAPAEIAVSPDGRFVVVSNRGDASFCPGDGDAAECSDSLATFRVQDDGTLAFVQLAAAGGSFPRQFSLNNAGDKVAVGLQMSGRVVVLGRNVETGLIGPEIARQQVEGQVTCVVWDQPS